VVVICTSNHRRPDTSTLIKRRPYPEWTASYFSSSIATALGLVDILRLAFVVILTTFEQIQAAFLAVEQSAEIA
jgi:hypothetical protein